MLNKSCFKPIRPQSTRLSSNNRFFSILWHTYNLIALFLSDYLVNVPNGEGDEADDNGGDEGAGEGQATHPVHKLISIHTTIIRYVNISRVNTEMCVNCF